MAEPKCLTFQPELIEAEILRRFPDMHRETLRQVVLIAAQIVDQLWRGRESRIGVRGEPWRIFDGFAEAVAVLFTLESMTRADASEETGRTLNVLHQAVHAVYCTPEEHQGVPSMPKDMRPPKGRGGFDN